jgi:hypothetical protein
MYVYIYIYICVYIYIYIDIYTYGLKFLAKNKRSYNFASFWPVTFYKEKQQNALINYIR